VLLFCALLFAAVQYDLASSGGVIMLESFIHLVTAGASASHTPQTAVAALLCATLVGLFS